MINVYDKHMASYITNLISLNLPNNNKHFNLLLPNSSDVSTEPSNGFIIFHVVTHARLFILSVNTAA